MSTSITTPTHPSQPTHPPLLERLCDGCHRPFTPPTRYTATQRYCSRACASRAKLSTARERLTAGQSADGSRPSPAHGGAAAEARRASLARRRAAGELLGRQLHNARAQGLVSPSSRAFLVNGVVTSAAPGGSAASDCVDAPTTTSQTIRPANSNTAINTPTAPSPSAHSHSPHPSPIPALPPTPSTRATPPKDASPEEYRLSGERYDRKATRIQERRQARRPDEGRTLVITGFGAGLRVERDALVVTEGRTHYPQTPTTHTLYRGVHGVSRIVCLDCQGSLSFPAIQWCTQQQISVLLISRDGALLSALTPIATADAGLRRRQYMATETGQDVLIAQELLRRKLMSQRATLVTHPNLPGATHARDVLTTALAWLTLPELPPWLQSVDMVRTYEARTARAYFAAWAGFPLRWGKADAKRVPPHWLTLRERSSPLSPGGNARHAIDPANAMLNYAYALLEGQCRQALATAGFDVACGFLHADKAGRDSLVYDLMECERGAVDARVLALLATTTFHVGDLLAGTDGACRLHPQLARAVVGACRLPQAQLETHAQWLRTTLLASGSSVSPVSPTPGRFTPISHIPHTPPTVPASSVNANSVAAAQAEGACLL